MPSSFSLSFKTALLVSARVFTMSVTAFKLWKICARLHVSYAYVFFSLACNLHVHSHIETMISKRAHFSRCKRVMAEWFKYVVFAPMSFFARARVFIILHESISYLISTGLWLSAVQFSFGSSHSFEYLERYFGLVWYWPYGRILSVFYIWKFQYTLWLAATRDRPHTF